MYTSSGSRPVFIITILSLFSMFVCCATREPSASATSVAPDVSVAPAASAVPAETSAEPVSETAVETIQAPPEREPEPPLEERLEERPEESGTRVVLLQVSRLLAEREYAEALILFDEIDADDAGAAEIQLIKASIHNAAGQSAKARAIANSVLASQPDNVDALLVLAASAAAEGKDREQRTTLERIIKIEPQNVKALCNLGYIALSGNSLRTAANYFDRALAADNRSGEALIGRALVYRYNHDRKKAELLLHQAVRLYPQWASPRHERARLYKGAGFHKDALADLDVAKKLEPDNYWISVDRGVTLFELSRKEEALEELNRAIALNPNNFLAYVYSAGLKDDFGDIEGAENDYAKITKLKPEYYFAAEGLGIIKMKKQEWTQARDAFLLAYKHAPKDYSYALLAAVNWMRAGKISDPKQFLAQVIKTVPRDSAEWQILRLYHDLNNDLDTVMRAEKEENPDSKAKMLFYLAQFYDIRGSKSIADKYFMQVQELDCKGIIEWRINEWLMKQRELNYY